MWRLTSEASITTFETAFADLFEDYQAELKKDN